MSSELENGDDENYVPESNEESDEDPELFTGRKRKKMLSSANC